MSPLTENHNTPLPRVGSARAPQNASASQLDGKNGQISKETKRENRRGRALGMLYSWGEIERIRLEYGDFSTLPHRQVQALDKRVKRTRPCSMKYIDSDGTPGANIK